jgi:hypothetical protein
MKRIFAALIFSFPLVLAAQTTDSSEVTDSLIVSEELLEETENKDIGMKVFPNPTSKNATLQLRLYAPLFLTIDIVDHQGNVVKVITSKKFNGQDPSIYIDTNGLPAGTYLLRVLNEGGSVMASKRLKLVR